MTLAVTVHAKKTTHGNFRLHIATVPRTLGAHRGPISIGRFTGEYGKAIALTYPLSQEDDETSEHEIVTGNYPATWVCRNR